MSLIFEIKNNEALDNFNGIDKESSVPRDERTDMNNKQKIRGTLLTVRILGKSNR